MFIDKEGGMVPTRGGQKREQREKMRNGESNRRQGQSVSAGTLGRSVGVSLGTWSVGAAGRTERA